MKAVAVMDREGDMFDVLHEHSAAGYRRLALLVRARHDRSFGRGWLFERVRAAPEGGRFSTTVERLSARHRGAAGLRRAGEAPG